MEWGLTYYWVRENLALVTAPSGSEDWELIRCPALQGGASAR
jgi:hypothetical protein